LNGKISESDFKAIAKKDLVCVSMMNTDKTKLLDLKYPQPGTALLTIRTFDFDELSSAKEDYVRFIDSSFSDILKKRVQYLIIDLRNNGGGKDAYGSLLYSYLTARSFPYYRSLETTSGYLFPKDHPNLSIQNLQLIIAMLP